MNFLRDGTKIPHTIINIPSDGVYLGVCIYIVMYPFFCIFIYLFSFFLPLLSFPAIDLPLLFCLLPFASYASLPCVLLVIRENVLDIILRVVLRMRVLTFGMKMEWKYPTSKNISKIIRKKKRRMRVRSKKIRRRRIKKRGRMKGRR
jgi:hypothetical protein